MFISFVSGCATTSQSTAVNQLELRVAQLERKLDERDSEMEGLRYEIEELVNQLLPGEGSSISELKAESKAIKTAPSSASTTKNNKGIIRVPVTPQQVQTALKNAGYYDGAIDGKIGSKTRKSIENFQKDHDLLSDGIVGRKTWSEMQHYVE
jgi:murein L,D-transpeptidase YcbB/YkuD